MCPADRNPWRPFDVRVGTDRLAGGRCRPATDAHAEPADVIVLLHGFTGSHRSWDAIAPALARTRTVVAFDLPGHGDSDFGDTAAHHSMAHTAATLDGAFDALGITHAVVVGYSMGGRLALYLAATRPQRVSRLVLESASPGLATDGERAARRAADDNLARFVLERGIAAFVDRWETTPVLAAEQTLAAATRRTLRAQRLRCMPTGLAASLRGMGTGAQPWLGHQLARATMPTLLIAGGDDAKFVAIGRDLEARLPDARLRVVSGAGHNVHLQVPDTFVALLDDFLRSTRNGTPEKE
jgi:2-succinyl-6-hydroxy-2,4-cyclohexadiene-1-carboxylate synthase